MQDVGFFDPQEIASHVSIREGMHIADFGSGSGEIAVLLAKIVGESGVVTALDVLSSALEVVTSKARAASLKNLVAVRANLEVAGSSKLEDNSQDMVFLANILWQSKKQKEILEEVERVLKPQGRLVSLEWKTDASAGPPPEMRCGSEVLQSLVASVGLRYLETFAAGQFHYGLIAQKP